MVFEFTGSQASRGELAAASPGSLPGSLRSVELERLRGIQRRFGAGFYDPSQVSPETRQRLEELERLAAAGHEPERPAGLPSREFQHAAARAEASAEGPMIIQRGGVRFIGELPPPREVGPVEETRVVRRVGKVTFRPARPGVGERVVEVLKPVARPTLFPERAKRIARAGIAVVEPTYREKVVGPAVEFVEKKVAKPGVPKFLERGVVGTAEIAVSLPVDIPRIAFAAPEEVKGIGVAFGKEAVRVVVGPDVEVEGYPDLLVTPRVKAVKEKVFERLDIEPITKTELGALAVETVLLYGVFKGLGVGARVVRKGLRKVTAPKYKVEFKEFTGKELPVGKIPPPLTGPELVTVVGEAQLMKKSFLRKEFRPVGKPVKIKAVTPIFEVAEIEKVVVPKSKDIIQITRQPSKAFPELRQPVTDYFVPDVPVKLPKRRDLTGVMVVKPGPVHLPVFRKGDVFDFKFVTKPPSFKAKVFSEMLEILDRKTARIEAAKKLPKVSPFIPAEAFEPLIKQVPKVTTATTGKVPLSRKEIAFSKKLDEALKKDDFAKFSELLIKESARRSKLIPRTQLIPSLPKVKVKPTFPEPDVLFRVKTKPLKKPMMDPITGLEIGEITVPGPTFDVQVPAKLAPKIEEIMKLPGKKVVPGKIRVGEVDVPFVEIMARLPKKRVVSVGVFPVEKRIAVVTARAELLERSVLGIEKEGMVFREKVPKEFLPEERLVLPTRERAVLKAVGVDGDFVDIVSVKLVKEEFLGPRVGFPSPVDVKFVKEFFVAETEVFLPGVRKLPVPAKAEIGQVRFARPGEKPFISLPEISIFKPKPLIPESLFKDLPPIVRHEPITKAQAKVIAKALQKAMDEIKIPKMQKVTPFIPTEAFEPLIQVPAKTTVKVTTKVKPTVTTSELAMATKDGPSLVDVKVVEDVVTAPSVTVPVAAKVAAEKLLLPPVSVVEEFVFPAEAFPLVGRARISKVPAAVVVSEPVVVEIPKVAVLPKVKPVVLPKEKFIELPKVVTKAAPRILPKVIPKILPKVMPKVLPKVKPKVIPKVIQKVIPKVMPKVLPKVIPKVVPRVAPRILPRILPPVPTPKLLLPLKLPKFKKPKLVIPKKKKKRRDLFFIPGFTGRVVGVPELKLPRSEAVKLLRRPLTGLEIRPSVKVVGIK